MALKFEEQFYDESTEFIIGIDEAGRGPLLGPVVASAVILPPHFYIEEINDSKKLSEKQREKLFTVIKENAIAIGIGIVDAKKIDEINILEATKLAMLDALSQINHPYQLVLTDAVKLKIDTPLIPIIKGDAKAECIAAASIIAKVTRDHICYELDKKYPLYQIAKHKGYGTKIHLEALKKYGPIEGVHRYSFGPIKNLFIEKISLF
ncbi:MAG: ribonuclease HII [Bacilli bacterium]